MSYISIWTRSVVAQQDIPRARFVDPWGKLGGDNGIAISEYKEGSVAAIISLGEAEVEAKPSEAIAIGDKVVGDSQGLAIKSTTTSGCIVLSATGSKIKVLVR